MRKILGIMVMAFLVLALAAETDAKWEKYRISVFFWHESPLDEKAFEGVKDGFKKAGVDCEFDCLRAFGDEEKAGAIIQKLTEEKPDLIYGMGTGATKRLMKVIYDTPIVFTAVTNPVQSGITPNWESSGRNIAGNSNWIPTEEILTDFKKVVPALKSLGVMYDPDNPVSSMEVNLARQIIGEMGMRLVEIKIKTVDDLTPACRDLAAKKVDAIWIPIEILAYKNMDKIKTIADPAKIPLLASSHRGVKDGAIFGEVVDYHDLGRMSASIALMILDENAAPEDISIWTMADHKSIINLKAAREIGYDIPPRVLAVSDEVIE